MKNIFFKAYCILAILVVTLQLNVACAMGNSISQNPDSIKITNNTGKSDTVYVTDILAGDIVKVYNAALGGKLLGSATVASSKTEVTVTIPQLGTAKGIVYVSVTSKGMLESDRIAAVYSAEETSDAPDVANITIINNSGASDTVTVSGLSPSDIVKVYNAALGGKLLGKATAASSKTEATVTISQLGTAAGSVYVSVTGKGKIESTRIEATYTTEPKSSVPNIENITINNNAGIADTVNVSRLSSGDLVKVYALSGKLLGSITVATSKTEATVSIAQVGKVAGSLYVSVKGKNMLESDRIEVSYPAETVSSVVDADSITVTNNALIADTVNVVGLTVGDLVKVYDALTGGKLLGFATVASPKTEVTITIAQLGTSAGSVYVSKTSKGMLESTRIETGYSGETKSDAPDSKNIIINNNIAGTSDTVNVTILTAGDLVKVYDALTGGKLLGSATVAASKAEVTVTIAQLGTAKGSVYVSVKGKGKEESDRTVAYYSAEPQSITPDADNITVTNNAIISDTIKVTNLSDGDVVKVYDLETGGSLLGSTTVASSSATVTVSVAQLGTTEGSVYVSKTSKGMLESARIKADYSAETKSTIPVVGNIAINNTCKSDTVKVTGLSSDDVINVYDLEKKGKLLGSATVATSETEATVTIEQLGSAAGSVYVSKTSKGLFESDRVEVTYSAESKSAAPVAGKITVSNDAGKSDTVKVTGLSYADVVQVYDSAIGGNLLGKATVATSETEVSISVAQLGTAAGSVYVSVTSTDMLESDRVKKTYLAETQSTAPVADNITIVNNSGSDSTVIVTGVVGDDKINVYDSETGGKLLGSATVSTYDTEATISITQLSSSGGTIYVTVTSTGKTESARTAAAFSAEQQSAAPTAQNITVTNNAITSDTIKVTSLSAGDVVKVYDLEKGGSLLGSATVASSSTMTTVSVLQLGTAAGSVYVSVTSKKMLESARIKADYSAETKSTIPVVGNITINNTCKSDTVKITGLSSDDVINIYDLEKGGNLLGSANVDTSETEATVTIEQLGSAAGSVYVSKTSKGLFESDRVEVTYSAEPKSAAPVAGKITVINNAGKSDTVKVTGLSSADVVKVYDSAIGGNLLGKSTVATSETEASISVTQLGTAAGSVYVSVTSTDMLESDRVEKIYLAEAKSADPVAGNITVVNNSGIDSIVTVTGLVGDDEIKVYDSETGGKLLGSAVVSTYDTEATVSITQLSSSGGTIYVTVTSTGKTESGRIAAAFSAVTQSAAPVAGNITIVNNAGMPGTVKVTGLVNKDIVNVYDSETGGKLLGSATVSTYATEAIVSVTQLGASGGTIYVTVTSTGKTESSRLEVTFSDKVKSNAPVAGNITIDNNVGIADTVTVTGLAVGDVIKVYDKATGGELLGSATVATDSMQVIVSITQLGTTSGSVYCTATTSGKTESDRIECTFSAEKVSDAPSVGNIIIVNNSGLSDTVTVSGLIANDIVKLYNAATEGSLLGKATVATDSSTVVISIQQLGASSGSIYVTVTSKGKNESSRTQADYTAESTAPIVNNITIVNNAGMSDNVTVIGLVVNDIVKVYDSATGGTLLGSETVSSSGGQAVVTISQLTPNSGSVYVSVTSLGKSESARTKADYIGERYSDPIYSGSVTITNNKAGTLDNVVVINLLVGDLVKVYNLSTGGNLLGSATVANSSTQATVTIAQLGTDAGSVYISHTSLGKKESSERLKVDYIAEAL